MSIPVFNIIQDDLSFKNCQDCRIVIEMNPQYFYYTVLDKSNAVIGLKYYALVYNNNQEMISMLDEIVHEDLVLKEKISSCHIVFNWPENCLVPANYFNKDLSKEMLDLIHGNLNDGPILSEKISGAETYVVYRVPASLNNFLQRIFPGCAYSHYYTLWLDCILKDATTTDDLVSIIFNPNEIIIAVFIGKQLQVIQNLQYQTPEDIAWQLLNIYQRFDFNAEETPLLVSGMIDQNAATYEELLKYFQSVEFDLMPKDIIVPEQFQSFPEHFFSPLLKMALCVS